MTDWDKIKHFKKTEFSGYDKMDSRVIETMEKLRVFLNAPIVIHEAYATKGHANGSKHYLGKAVDFHVKDMRVIDTLWGIETFLEVNDLTNKSGLGMYLDWNSIGFHLDLHAINKKRRWGRIKFEDEIRMVSLNNTVAYFKYLAMNRYLVYNEKRCTYRAEEKKYEQ